MDFIHQGVSSEEVLETLPVPTQKRRELSKTSRFSKNTRLSIALAAVVVLSASGFLFWRLFIWQPAVVNPFTTKTQASVQFPLYYPTQLPSGYRIDPKSVSEPQQDVVLFNLIGPRGEKIYLSEEARPQTFNLGGFYDKFQDLKETPVSDGSVAVGRLNGGQTEVASRANNKTWVLSNTNANIPLDQLTTMLKSLSLSY